MAESWAALLAVVDLSELDPVEEDEVHRPDETFVDMVGDDPRALLGDATRVLAELLAPPD